jgi:hypothetical protein
MVVLLLGNIFYFAHQYFVHTNSEFQKDWQYGYKDAVMYTKNLSTDKKIVFDMSMEQIYMFYLFYTKFDPAAYIKIDKEKRRVQAKCFTITNAYFGECKDKLVTGDYFVTADVISQPTLKKIKEFQYSNQQPAVTIYEYQ